MRKNLVAMACCSLAVSTPVSAATVFDPVGDFLPSYTGPQIGELDVTSFSVVFDPGTSIFTIGGTLAGAIDPGTGGFYAIGVDTGAGAIDDPRYFVLILLDEPRGNAETFGFSTGGWVAAPAAGKVIDRIAPFLGVRRHEPAPLAVAQYVTGAEGDH